jgi:hypothetical protein
MKLFEECQFYDKRYVGCHANCPTYIRDRKRLDEVKAKQRLENDYIEYCKFAIRNMKRKRR